jgi:hypothetical protein
VSGGVLSTEQCLHARVLRRGIIRAVSFPLGTAIGFFLGFAFGVGCALAVMYSIYLGGYRAAVRDSQSLTPPPRFIAVREKITTKLNG